MPNSDDLSWLSDDERDRLNTYVHTFELAWQQGGAESQPVELEPFLPAQSDRLRQVVLHRLIGTDLAARWQHGQNTLLEHYLREFPELGTPAELPVALIHEEYRVRARHGPAPALAEYEDRFPAQFSKLRRLIESRGEAPAKLPSTTPGSPAPPSGSALDIQAGAVVGAGYRLINRLGRGAFGEVWKAEAPGGIEVAVKIIVRSLTEKEAKGERQALELTKRLRHGYLLQTQAFWALEDRLLIVMELADGSLRDRFRECLAQGRPGVPIEELLPYLEQSAQALDYLHENRLLHRDIKPENILRVGKLAKVADFGLAMVLPETVRSVSISSAGTIPYMAPEVWYGKACEGSDLWSLAVTYVELRLGRLLFGAGNQAEMMFAILNNTPDLAGLHPAEQDVLRQALAKEHVNRFASSSEFTDALRQALTPFLPVRKTSGVRSRVVPVVPSKASPPAPETRSAEEVRPDPVPVLKTAAVIETMPTLAGRETAPAAGEFGTVVVEPKAPRPEKRPPSGQAVAAPPSTVPAPYAPPHLPAVPLRPVPGGDRQKLVVLVGALAAGVAVALGVLVWAMLNRTKTDPTAVVALASEREGVATKKPDNDVPPALRPPHDLSNQELLDSLDALTKQTEKRAEQLVEEVAIRLDRLPPDKAEAAAEKLDRPDLPPALSPYADYIRAALLEKKDKAGAANRLAKALAGPEPPAVLLDKDRQLRAGRILLAPAQQLRERGTYDRPFGDSADAEQAYRWLSLAPALLKAGQLDDTLANALRLNLVLAAWNRPNHAAADEQLVLDLAGPLLSARDKLKPADLCPLLLARAGALTHLTGTAARPALKDYEDALELTHKLGEGDADAAAVAAVDAVLTPALQLGERLLQQAGDADLKVQVAALSAAEARRITDHRYARWSFTDLAGKAMAPDRKAFELYDRAVGLDSTRADYFVGRGMVRSGLPAADLDLVEKDAVDAQQRDGKNPGGYFLAGYVAHQRARAEADPEKRWNYLTTGLGAYDQAQTRAKELPPGKDHLSATLLVDRSNICLDLGNHSADPDLRKKYLCQARAEARLATAAEGQRYPDEAWAALGNAQEDIAWQLGDTANYKAAVEAFGKARDFPMDDRTEAKRLVDLSRVRYRWVRFGGGDKDLLDRAEQDLRIALRRQADPLTWAKAHDWLGLIALERGDAPGAEGEFRQVAENLLDPKGSAAEMTRYASDWVGQRRNEFDRYPPTKAAAPVLARAIRGRIRPGGTGGERLQDTLDIAWSYEVENKPAEALARYTDALPADLTRTKAADLPLLLACGYLLMGSEADLAVEKKRSLETLAKQALELTSGDAPAATRRNAALGFAGVAYHQMRTQKDIPEDKNLAWHNESKKDLAPAVAAAPNDPNCPLWRVALALELAVDVQFDPRLTAAEKTRLRTEIGEQLDTAERAGWERLRQPIEELRKTLNIKKGDAGAKPKEGGAAAVDC